MKSSVLDEQPQIVIKYSHLNLYLNKYSHFVGQYLLFHVETCLYRKKIGPSSMGEEHENFFLIEKI